VRQLLCALLFLVLASLAPAQVQADPADIAAASRSVVRVVVFAANGDNVPIGHGSGIVVAPDRILTNAHVVAEEEYDGAIRVMVIPSETGGPIAAEVIARSPRNDLALIALRNGRRLTPAALFTGPVPDGVDVFAIGYPGGVDVAQGLDLDDVMRPQAPVKTRGNISAGRSAKGFETLLHTAAIGSGNSGGPLVDACGRVLGVNSFGTISDGSDAEFFFAIAQREVATFLRSNGVAYRSVDAECLSRADMTRAEAERAAAEKARIEEENRRADAARSRSFTEARRQAEYDIIETRRQPVDADGGADLYRIGRCRKRLATIGARTARSGKAGWRCCGVVHHCWAHCMVHPAQLFGSCRDHPRGVSRTGRSGCTCNGRHSRQADLRDRPESQPHHRFRYRRRAFRLAPGRLRQRPHPICGKGWHLDPHLCARSGSASFSGRVQPCNQHISRRTPSAG